MTDDYDPFAPIFGERVRREARFVIDPIMGSKRLQAVSLQFDDGDAWILRYRPRPEDLEWVDKRVVVTGRPYENSPEVQSVMATHFELETLELAPGERPHDPIPTELPSPPMVKTPDELAACVGQWVQLVGMLIEVGPMPDVSFWQRGRVVLADGTAVEVSPLPEAPSVEIGAVAASGLLVGRPIVTVLGTVVRAADGLRVQGRTLCLGEEPRCGMSAVGRERKRPFKG